MRFKSFLLEQEKIQTKVSGNKVAIFTGRFQPFTEAHQKACEWIDVHLMKPGYIDSCIVLTKGLSKEVSSDIQKVKLKGFDSTDAMKDNPLKDFGTKKEIIEQFLPNENFSVVEMVGSGYNITGLDLIGKQVFFVVSEKDEKSGEKSGLIKRSQDNQRYGSYTLDKGIPDFINSIAPVTQEDYNSGYIPYIFICPEFIIDGIQDASTIRAVIKFVTKGGLSKLSEKETQSFKRFCGKLDPSSKEANIQAQKAYQQIKSRYGDHTDDLVVESQLLLEGGAQGHMNHPRDQDELTIVEFKRFMNELMTGSRFDSWSVSEKIDGYNLNVSMQNGSPVFARSEEQRNTPMTIDQLKQKYTDAQSKFKEGKKALAIFSGIADLFDSISDEYTNQLTSILDEGEYWINGDGLYESDMKPTNMIFYGTKQTFFVHSVVDKNNVVNAELTKKLHDLIGEYNNSEWTLRFTSDIILNIDEDKLKSMDFSEDKQKLDSLVETVQEAVYDSKLGLDISETTTMGDIRKAVYSAWEGVLTDSLRGLGIDSSLISKMKSRLENFMGYKEYDFKADYHTSLPQETQDKIKQTILSIEKDKSAITRPFLPFDDITASVGAKFLSCLVGFLGSNSSMVDLANIKITEKNAAYYKLLQHISAEVGLPNTEGVVINNGKYTLKITGLFQVLNKFRNQLGS